MSRPCLIMSIIVRDEADIIGENLEWHRRQGVDRFVVIDHGSTDGTSDLLRQFSRHFPLDLIRRDDPVVDHVNWLNRLIRDSHARYRHHWHIANDADEFWLPPDGHTLKSYLMARHPDDAAVLAPRTNVLYARDDLERVGWKKAKTFKSLVDQRIPKGLHDPAEPMAFPHEYYVTPGKVVVQPQFLRKVNKGAHSAAMKRPGPPAKSAMQILHFPFRSAHEFLSSAHRLGVSARENQPKAEQLNVSARYRRWLQMIEAGVPDAVILDEAMPSQARLDDHLRQGLLEPLELPQALKAVLALQQPVPVPTLRVVARQFGRLGDLAQRVGRRIGVRSPV